MAVYNFIVEKLFPLFGNIPDNCLEWFNVIYWITVSCVTVYWLVYVPHDCVRKLARLPRFFRGGEK